MKRKLALSLLLLASPATLAVPASGQTIDGYLAQALESTALPGMSVVVTHLDRVVFAGGYGHDSAGAAVTAHTPMRVASVSKSFTAMAVMTLVDDGRVALDEPVARQLPEFRLADPRYRQITVRQLLNQTSGLSDTAIDIPSAESASSLAGYVSALHSGSLAASPGTRWAYCNANYEVAARLVEVAAATPFGDYLRQRVFGPLGMTASGVGGAAARGFNSLFGAWVARPEPRDVPYGGGAGGVVTTAADMGPWLISQNGYGRQLVTPPSRAAMHAPSPVRDYGMGWGRDTIGGNSLLVHSGNLFTYTAVEAIVPETGYGFAVMTNSAGLYDDTYRILADLVAISQGRTPGAPGGRRQAIELVLGLIAIVAVTLGCAGVVRSRRWAARRAGRPAWRTAFRLVPALSPALLFAGYPTVVSFLMSGRTVTWKQLTYFAAPLTIAVAAAAAAGTTTVVLRLLRWRSVASTR